MMLLPEHIPTFSTKAASQLSQEMYGIYATATQLPSEWDQNFLLTTQSGERFVLKIANAAEDHAFLDAQQKAMTHVAHHTSLCPRVVPTLSGDTMTEVKSSNGLNHFLRIVTYLPGVTFSNVKRHSVELLNSLGCCMGKVDRALASFDHSAAHRDFHWDLANIFNVFEKYAAMILDVELREMITDLVSDFERKIFPLLPKLRTSVVHNDANDYNVIVGGGYNIYTRNQNVIGVIDFGDMVHSYMVSDLAVTIAYAILEKSDPLATASHIVKSYHAEHPLDEYEISALFYLVRMRLCLSALLAAHQQRQRPDNSYLVISQQPIRHTLPRLARINARFAEMLFRHVCGLSPAVDSAYIATWLEENSQSFSSVLDEDLRTAPCTVFDLSVGSSLVSGDTRENAEPRLTKRLYDKMASASVKYGIGRYDEPRLLYTTQMFATGECFEDERRVLHLGIDIFAEAGTPVSAPLAGIVHSFANNDSPEDYGPIIILRHHADDHHIFYTLYGHLSEESLKDLYVGKPIAQGERFATIGSPDVNGGWTPHIHFQIIIDHLNLGCDFPGVGLVSQREVWRSLSPDPNLILGIPSHRFPVSIPTKAETLALRRKRTGSNLIVAYKDPIKVSRGWMQYLYDEAGRRYLDAYNNVPHVGHCHPQVVRAGCEQMAVLNTNTRYLHDFTNFYVEKLCATLPDPLTICFLLNSGSEANELALRLARTYTGRSDMIVLDSAYHGHTNALIDISPYKHNGPGGTGTPHWVHTAPIPDTYRGVYKYDDPRSGEKYARHVSEIIEHLHQAGVGIAGYIAESFPSVGGQLVLPQGYLAAVYAAVRKTGGVCIADEIQTGYGRVGTHFWGFETQGVIPDIVVLGKTIGNGHPIGAVITTPEIASSFDNGMEFFSTFGGNTVSCAIGLSVLEAVLEENLQSHAHSVGKHLHDNLRLLVEEYEMIGDVRGSGLFLGVELVRDRKSLVPATEEASFISNRMRELGILLGTDGPYQNVLKIRPPMPFSESDSDYLVTTLRKVLSDDFG